MPSFELYDGSAVFHSVKRGVGLSTLILSLFGWLLNTYFVPVSDYPTDFRVSIECQDYRVISLLKRLYKSLKGRRMCNESV